MVAGANPENFDLTKGRKLHNIQKLTVKHMNNVSGSTYKYHCISVLPSWPRVGCYLTLLFPANNH